MRCRYIPVAGIQIQFLNRRDVISLNHHGHKPDTFKQAALQAVHQARRRGPPRLHLEHPKWECALSGSAP